MAGTFRPAVALAGLFAPMGGGPPLVGATGATPLPSLTPRCARARAPGRRVVTPAAALSRRAVASVGDGFGLDGGVRLVALDHHLGQLALDEPLDVPQQLVLVHAHQGDRLPLVAGPAGATDAVHVILRDVRQLEVHHMGQLVDVQAAGGDVGGHQHPDGVPLEVRQGAGARGLALVAVNGRGGDAVRLQILGQAVGTMLGAGEHQHLAPVVGADEVGEQLPFALAVHRMDHLLHPLRGGVAAGHFDEGGAVQQPVGQLLDFVREGGREEQVLTPLGQQGQHLADVADEAHVEHPVGLVQHQDLDLGEVHGVLAHVVQQAPGGGHEDVHSAAQPLDLRVDLHPAEDDGGLQGQVFAIGVHALAHLGRQLTGGGKDEGADGAPPARLRRGEALQQWQGETGGFAGTGLGPGHDVPPLQNHRDGLALNGGGLAVALFGHGTEDFGREAEGIKRHTDLLLLVRPTRSACRLGTV